MVNRKIFLEGAWSTISRLFGGLTAGLLLGTMMFHLIPGSDVDNPSPVHASISAIGALTGLMGGGAAWGLLIARQAGFMDRRKAATAGALGFGLVSLIMAAGLGMLEPSIVMLVGPGIPIHRLFTILFTISALIITGVSVWVISRAVGFPKHANRMALQAALVAAGAFLVVNLTMEQFGWVVGAPGAERRATMLVVMLLGNLATAAAAGGVFAIELSGLAQDADRASRQ